MTAIVKEMPKHHAAVRQLTIEAFAHSALGHNGEADLIEAIREHCGVSVSLVAIDDNHVVGHILFSPATIRTGSSTMHGMALAPLAVLPAHQRLGIGAMLVTDGLRRTQSIADFIIVAGHRDYYPRFGFNPAKELSIMHGFKGMSQDILFIRVNDRNQSSLNNNGGLVYFDTAFGPQHVG
jgi:putative acetyltransferase